MKFKEMCVHQLIIDPLKTNVWVIGDVHGCAEEFDQLCGNIKAKDDDAVIIQLGDLIDRGPYLKEVFDVVERYEVKTTIGNHELNFILEYDGYKRCASKARQETHQKLSLLSQENQDSILRTMKQSSNYIRVVMELGKDCERVFYLSHSPIRGFEQRGVEKTNAWSCCSRNDAYNESLISNKVLFFCYGHQHWNYTNIADQIETESRCYNLDSGCVYGNELVAFNLCDYDIMRVPALKTYKNYND